MPLSVTFHQWAFCSPMKGMSEDYPEEHRSQGTFLHIGGFKNTIKITWHPVIFPKSMNDYHQEEHPAPTAWYLKPTPTKVRLSETRQRNGRTQEKPHQLVTSIDLQYPTWTPLTREDLITKRTGLISAFLGRDLASGLLLQTSDQFRDPRPLQIEVP